MSHQQVDYHIFVKKKKKKKSKISKEHHDFQISDFLSESRVVVISGGLLKVLGIILDTRGCTVPLE